MANKPNPADFSPTVPDFPSIGQYQPIYGKFDLTTYIQGASDYEIMAFLVQCYNATLKGYGDVTQLSKDTVIAYNQLQTWVNTWFNNLDVKQDIDAKLEQMLANGELATVIASSDAMIPAIDNYFASENGNAVLSNKTSEKINDMATTGTLTDIVKETGQVPPAVAQYLNSVDGSKELSDATAEKIEEMANNGELGTVISKTTDLQKTTTDWLTANVTPVGSAVVVDKSLSIEGAAADSKVTGNSIDSLKKEVSNDYKYIIGEYPLIEIAKGTSNITHVLYNTNNGVVFADQTNGNGIIVDIPSDAKYLCIDAQSITKEYGFYCILDSSNNVIKNGYTEDNNHVEKYIIVTIPKGASKIAVNSNYFNNTSLLPVVRAAKDITNRKLICNYDNLRSGFDNSGKITSDDNYMCTSNLINVSNMDYVTIYAKTNRIQDGFYAIYSDINTFVDVVPWESFPSEANITIDTSNIKYIRVTVNKYSGVEYTSDTIKIVGYLNKPITNNIIKNYRLPVNTTNVGYVGTSEKAQYNTIGSAYNALGRGNCSLIIEPSIYNERFNAEDFRLFGISESNCIVRYQNGYYPYAVLEPAGNIYCENLTFVTENDTTKTNHAYALHVEAIDNLGNVDKTMIFKHCTFVSDLAPAIGVGMSKGLQMYFEDCTFYSQSESAIFFHDSVYSEALGEQFISFKDCKFISASDCSIKIQSVNENNRLTCEFIDCTSTALYGANNSLKILSPASEGFLCGNSVKLSKTSHGNNIDMLNAIDG